MPAGYSRIHRITRIEIVKHSIETTSTRTIERTGTFERLWIEPFRQPWRSRRDCFGGIISGQARKERSSLNVLVGVVEDGVPALDPLITDDGKVVADVLADDASDAGRRAAMYDVS